MTLPIPDDVREALRIFDEAHIVYAAAAHALQGCTWVWTSDQAGAGEIPPGALCHVCGRTYRGGQP